MYVLCTKLRRCTASALCLHSVSAILASDKHTVKCPAYHPSSAEACTLEPLTHTEAIDVSVIYLLITLISRYVIR